MSLIADALERLETLDPQVRTEVIRGVSLRKRMNRIPVLSIHYSADPDRDPETEVGAAWFEKARRDYSSQSAWDREQEMDAMAGGGERVFGKVLTQFYDVVVITDPLWAPDPRWDCACGFDHGKVNATALEKAYIDFQGNLYFAGEYYSFQREDWSNDLALNVPEILKMPDLDRMRWCMADPSIFPDNVIQKDGSYTSVNKVYRQHGLKFLKQYEGERSDLTFVEKVLSEYWRDLENKKPKLYIVARNASDRLQPGLHPYDSPNLLWELQRTRRAELSAKQMMTRNPTEKIVDKLNHARDACFAAGTMVTTMRGQVPIEEVAAGDLALTRKGWKKIERAWMTNLCAEVLRVRFSNGAELVGTPEHPVFLNNGDMIRLDGLKYGMIVLCQSTDHQKSPLGWESTSTDTHSARRKMPALTSETEASICTRWSGYLRTAGRFLRSTISTTRMRMREITILPTLRHSQAFGTSLPIPARVATQRSSPHNSTECENSQRNGTAPLKEELGTLNMDAACSGPFAIRNAPSAAKTSRTEMPRRGIASALKTAVRRGEGLIVSIMSNGIASFAAKSSHAKSKPKPDSAAKSAEVSVVEVSPVGVHVPVYNLSVAEEPEFYANGILVHNCKYLLFTLHRPSELPEAEQLEKHIEGLNPMSAQIAAQRWLNQRKKAKGQISLVRKKWMR
ncbi:MAG: hypothetical protein ACLQLH_03435 [Terracidiphilus sp.]